MASLSRELRKTLERVVIAARRTAEGAAKKALESLAVGEKAPHASMAAEKTGLRNRLRAHGRQLGDSRNAENGTQELEHLVTECAYEHWHRMLFARFLAENQLLIEPDNGVAVDLDEVKELARVSGQDWVALAGEYAVRMLPQVFRQDDPVLDVLLAPEDRKALEEMLASLPEVVFTTTDSLGWCYQFWQTERKKEVNDTGDKIGADELPAVTQLFTEDYMVDFLLDNTIGSWHAGNVLAANPKLAETAQSEDELRQAVALPGCSWSYLRFIKGQDGRWTPAAGTFDGWPNAARELKCLDPCMGSGHFVVAMFERLIAVRMAEEKLGEKGAVAAVIRENLFGLEIDPRCTQIGAFNLALAAWRRVGHCPLPAMNLACSGLAPNTREADWIALAGRDEKVKNGMARVYRLFKDAPVLGSLINPRAGEADLLVASFHELQPLLEKALAQESKNDTALEMAVTACGLAKAAEILAGEFTLVATNVPYLSSRKQCEELKNFCTDNFPHAKNDLGVTFMLRLLTLCSHSGSLALVMSQYWLFKSSYSKVRESILQTFEWPLLAKLGPGAFETITGEVVNVLAGVWNRTKPTEEAVISAIDVMRLPSPAKKAEALSAGPLEVLSQVAQLKNSAARIVIGETSEISTLELVAIAPQGTKTGDDDRWRVCMWEVDVSSEGWVPYQTTVRDHANYGGRHLFLDWRTQGDGMIRPRTANLAVGKWGVAISQSGALPATIYSGERFDSNIAPLILRDSAALPALWAYCTSGEYLENVRLIDQSLKVTNVPLIQVPFDVAHWKKVAAEKYPDGLPKPFSSDPTQWLFNGHPTDSDQPLQVAVARLLGYQWPRQTGSIFPDCPALATDGLEALMDSDGIVCLESLKGEAAAATRLQRLLAAAYGKAWSATRQADLLAGAGAPGKSLGDWLRDELFEQHSALFHNRPFIWHLWDGLQDGFQALVNYHKLAAPNGEGLRTLQSLTFSYLGDWINRQRAEQKSGKEGADAKLAAAVHLQDELKLILAGEPPYDLFVRWKPLSEQAIGWEPDINDGVRMNIRPFMMAETLKGKSIFRKEPRIKWTKDRGKEPQREKRDFPWFWSWDEETEDFTGGRDFDGNRWNDLHYSNEVKREARARHKGKGR